MPKLSGVFEIFKNLEKIPPENLNNWLKIKQEAYLLQNFIGNRILYPQVIPLTTIEMALDLSLLIEAVRFDKSPFIDEAKKKIFIPKQLYGRFPNLSQLVTAFIQALDVVGIWVLYLKSPEEELVLGTVIAPSVLTSDGPMKVVINGKEYQADLGEISVYPNRDHHLRVIVDSLDEVLVTGGDVGLLVDLRKGASSQA